MPESKPPEILDLEACELWPGDMVEEGLFVKTIVLDHRTVALDLGTPDQVDHDSSWGHERLWCLRWVLRLVLAHHDQLRVVRGMTLWPKYRPMRSREQAEARLGMRLERDPGGRTLRDYELYEAGLKDPNKKSCGGDYVLWRPSPAEGTVNAEVAIVHLQAPK